jgi:hypothetical protein
VRFAKAKPENLIYGHPGPASQPHLGMLAVLKAIGADGLGVPFQGAGPMAQALLSGTVMAITETPAVATASNLPVLAALTDRRIAALPDVRTMKELGTRPNPSPQVADCTSCYAASPRCRLGAGMFSGDSQRGVQNNCRAAQRRGPPFSLRRLPQKV